MRVVTRRFLWLVAAASVLTACGSFGSGGEKQWYKAGADYTVAEFQRDRAACEKSGKLDEDCLKERGWTPLSADKAAPPPPLPTGPRGSTGRY